jgi:hypothetical protein
MTMEGKICHQICHRQMFTADRIKSAMTTHPNDNEYRVD